MKNGRSFFTALTLGILAIDLLFFLMLFNSGLNVPIMSLVIFCNLVYIVDIFVCLRKSRAEALEYAAKIIYDKAEKLYLCGLNINQYAINAAFYRFGQWADNDFSYVTSVIAMFLLKGNKTARLYKGRCYSRQKELRNHYWVEFYIKKHQYVLDLTLRFKPISFEIYSKAMGPVPNWNIGYGDFWDIGATYQIYMAMQDSDTSYVFDLLTKLYFNTEDGQGFAKGIQDFEVPKDYHMQSFKLPNGKTVESDTLRDFIKDPDLIF